MELVFIEVKQIVVAVSVFVCVNPLVRIGWSPVAFVRPTITIAIDAPIAVFGGRACRVRAGIRLVCRGWVVAKAVAIGIVPLGSFGGERIHNAVALVRGVVTIVVLVDVSVPIVHALVVSTVGGHDVG